MRKIFLPVLITSVIAISLQSCKNKDTAKNKSEQTEQVNSNEKPSSPNVKTDYGELPGGYKTMDEYYLDSKGNKVWHGRRVNMYPSGAKKMEAFYEHGESKGYVKYDEAGNVTEDTRK